MSRMKIAVPHLDRVSPGIDDFMTSIILRSKEKRINCQFISPNEAIIEGEKETLLEILDELDNSSFSKIANKVGFTIEFDKSNDKALSHIGIELPNREQGKPDGQMLHDMVVKRLVRLIKGEKDNRLIDSITVSRRKAPKPIFKINKGHV